jgi:retron-type reverse transcriptase
LKQIRQQFKAITWYIEGDIKGCFDNIDHDKLMGILSKKIQDNRLLRLIRNGLQAGVVDEWVYKRTNSGTPQGGILSPLLANIFLNELDNFVETTLIPKWNIGDERCRNPQARQYEYLIKKAKERQDHEELKRLIVERRNIPSKDVNDPNFRRLKYVRYADDVRRRKAA